MKIVCPTCSAAYDVPEDRMRPGRLVKCARCEGTWAPVPADPVAIPEPAEPDPAPPEPAIEDEPPPDHPETPEMVVAQPPAMPVPPPAPARPRKVLALAWAVSAIVLLALLATAIVRRDMVMQLWPPSERIYAPLGLAH